jgi:hypothetical protein
MFPKIAGPWAAVPLTGNPVNSLGMVCPLSGVVGCHDLYRIAFAQAEETIQHARFTRRVLESGSGEHAWN